MTTSDPAPCPGCGGAMARIADHGIRFECGCGARMLGIARLEHLLDDGVGARLWVASNGGDPAGRCPFCAQAMRAVPAEADGPPGMAACHTCQQMWVPPSADGWLATHAPRAAALADAPAAHPHRCDGCGAPWQPDNDGRCRFCHAQLSAAQPIVVTLTPARRPPDTLIGVIADLLEG